MKYEQLQLQLPHTEFKLVKVGETTCSKCYGSGEIDLIACHGFGAPPQYWTCGKCKGTGKEDKTEFMFV